MHIEVRQSLAFRAWLLGLKDARARRSIAQRIDRFRCGLMGDVKPVGDGVWEMRIDHGPGYRAYFVHRGDRLIMLLCGGDKHSQARDINRAKAMALDWEH